MPNKELRKLIPDNSVIDSVQSTGFDFSNGKVEHFHLEREGNGVKVVSDGIVDEDALVQSEKCNAGLENIIRLQTMRYGTLDNAIARNKERQVYADVSHIPTNFADQTEFVDGVQASVDELCAKLGITKEDLLKSNQETLAQLLAAKQAAASQPAAAETGGNQ